MAFYDLSKQERTHWVEKIKEDISDDFRHSGTGRIIRYFSDEDTYIRKSAYLSVGRVYRENTSLAPGIIAVLNSLLLHSDFKVRQTAINAAGEIGIKEFEAVEYFFDEGLFDKHYSVRNAVIGSVKKMGEKNPGPVLEWAKKYLHHEDKEVRREICHGIELRGRTHPQDILSLLRELQFDKTVRVKTTLIHVLGQIAYKKGCLATVVEHLKSWDNKELVLRALDEIIDVHKRYKNFAIFTPEEAVAYIDKHYHFVTKESGHK